ncbi:MAG: hypothetical protein Q6373_022015, partial [Candidatus Sigynarchaeota archaeon]
AGHWNSAFMAGEARSASGEIVAPYAPQPFIYHEWLKDVERGSGERGIDEWILARVHAIA